MSIIVYQTCFKYQKTLINNKQTSGICPTYSNSPRSISLSGALSNHRIYPRSTIQKEGISWDEPSRVAIQEVVLRLTVNFCFLPSLKLCLVGMKTGRMKNRERKILWKMKFSTVWLGKENGEDRKPKRMFSLPSPHFLSSQIGRKM